MNRFRLWRKAVALTPGHNDSRSLLPVAVAATASTNERRYFKADYLSDLGQFNDTTSNIQFREM